MSERFNILMCKFYKFYICAVVGVMIEYMELLAAVYGVSTLLPPTYRKLKTNLSLL